ncbi:hypothetical protein K9N68_29360 [Kovacikia minuta CCNUW1]|uniref:hypothetical protein n=1 Tax=Kovacikia minuta TaxID=2931930 RepID=UPI001CCCB095|nr:hypothetical protein [Kovacikia minuta]UBF25629.1 hypothetical protein K9N68_29360 [Kovacikia minuta CCNUW1]
MDWLSLPSLLESSNFLLAQTPLPSPSPSSGSTVAADVELLKSQLEFMKWMNTAFLGFLAFLGGLLTWFFKSNLEDAKKMAREMVRQELTNHLAPLVEAEARHVMRTLQVEQVVGDTVVDYYRVADAGEPLEYFLLKGRGFLDVRFWKESYQPRERLGSVLVIDFVNSEVLNIPELTSQDAEVRRQAYQQRDELVTRKIQNLIELRIGSPIMVIYIRPGIGRIEAVDNITQNFPEVKYYASANTPVTLMGIVVDSAYVAYGDRKTRHL